MLWVVLLSGRFGHRLPVDGVELLRQTGRYRSAIDGHYLQVELLAVIAHQRQAAQRSGLLPARGIPEGVTGLYALVAAGHAAREQQLPMVVPNTGDRHAHPPRLAYPAELRGSKRGGP